MHVWIDQDLCVGNGVCEEICPAAFQLVDGDIAYVLDGERLLSKGRDGTLKVPVTLEGAVIEAADECPAQCIHIQP